MGNWWRTWAERIAQALAELWIRSRSESKGVAPQGGTSSEGSQNLANDRNESGTSSTTDTNEPH